MNRIRKRGETSSAGEAGPARGHAAAMPTPAVETHAPGGFNRGAASAPTASAARGGDAQTISVAARVWLPAAADHEARM
jgi:hypothetical protein